MTMKNVVQTVLQNPPTQTIKQARNNLKRPVKCDFWFLFMIDFMYICKLADFKQVISGKS